MDHDALRSVRNAFYLGFYAQAMKEAKSLMDSNKDCAEWANLFYHRALAAQSPDEAAKAISASASTSLLAIKQWAIYKSATDDQQRELVLDTLKEWLSSDLTAKNVMLELVTADLFLQDKNYKEALKLASNNNAENLEKLSLCVQIYIAIDRLELAGKCAKSMTDLDDDDPLTQLTSAWLSLAAAAKSGPEKVTEAHFLFQELSEKFSPSVAVLNGLAVCEIHNKNYTSAFSFLKQARDLALQSGLKVSPETLLNSIVCLQQLRKSGEIITKVVAELKANYPHHPWFTKQAEADALFVRHAANYKFKQ